MTSEECLTQYGLIVAAEDLPAIRTLLAAQARAEREGEREDDLALLCAVQLFGNADLQDVLRIWDAKASGFDLLHLIDVQLLCGAGLERTKSFLASEGSASAAEALAYIEECEASGDFKSFTPADWMAHYTEYFATAEEDGA